MKITELLLAELEREAVGSRKTLENVPEGKNDWKPHEKSMALGNLATIVATIPGWLEMMVNMDELDINPPGGSKFKPQDWKTRKDLLEQFENSLKKGREVLQKTTDDKLLNTKWRMLNGGKVMSEQTRYEAVRDGVLNHMAHHRGQLTVYLRLNGAKVPAVYGPSADEGRVKRKFGLKGKFMPTISKENEAVTLVNVFTVESAQAAMAALAVRRTASSVKSSDCFEPAPKAARSPMHSEMRPAGFI